MRFSGSQRGSTLPLRNNTIYQWSIIAWLGVLP